MKLNPFKIERYFAPLEFAAPYVMCGSDCESQSIRELLDREPGAAEAFQEQWLGYTDTAGDAELREIIAGLHPNVDADGIIVHAGAEETIFTFMNAMLRPGDHVVVHYPCYQSLFEVARGIGCDVTRWSARAADGWRLDLNALEDALMPKTRAIVINCPHNPTGYLMDAADFHTVVELARSRGIMLFSDEVYRGLEYDAQTRLPAACDLYESAVSVGVLSKTYGLPGLRIGWTATQNREMRDAILYFKDYTTLCNSAPSEFLARVALKAREQIIARNLRIAESNLPLLREFFATHEERISWVEPKAGVIGFPTVASGDVDDFCQRVLDRTGVLLLPGTVYDDDSTEVRIGYGRRNMPEALDRLSGYLSGTPSPSRVAS